MKPPVLLRIYKNDQLESVQQFDREQIVIGRDAEVQLDLKDESVSPLHAVIEDRQSGYYVSDLGSQSGTFLRGQRVLDEPLQSGDELRLGVYRIEFFIGVPKPAAPPRPEAPPPPKVEAPPAVAAPPPAAETPPLPPAAAAPKRKVVPQVQVPPVSISPMAKESPASVTASTTGGVALAAKTWSTKKKDEKTFAPPSQVKDLSEVLKPQKGPLLEVVVAWKDRVLSTQHFKEKGQLVIGSGPNVDIVVPGMSFGKAGHPLIDLQSNATIRLSPDMGGQLWLEPNKSFPLTEAAKAGRLRSAGTFQELDLAQGEMVRVDLSGGQISLYIRYSAETPKALVAPLFDLTSSELTGVALAVLVALILGLYIKIYEPVPLDDGSLIEEPLRMATVTFQPPRPKPKPKVVQIEEQRQPPREKKVVEIKEAKPKQQQRKQVSTQPKDPGTASDVRPTPKPAPKDTPASVHRQGGAVKMGDTAGASAKTQRPDPTKVGLLGALGGGGTRQKLDRAATGSGEITGLADRATGRSGQAESRPGEGIGGRLRQTGGGTGAATEGIAGVGTKGRGTGNFGFGTGGSLGERGSVNINIEGQGAEFSPTIDREAIRRVIIANRTAIRSCYETQLNRNPNLYGRVVLEWDIDERGRVIRAVINSNSMANNSVADCVLRLLRTWRFPEMPPDQIGRVLFPFVFNNN